jgi:hypothetical protein
VWSRGQKISHTNLPLELRGAQNVEKTGARKCRVPSSDTAREPDSGGRELGDGKPACQQDQSPNSYIEAAFSPLPFSLVLTKRSMSAMV